MKSAHRQTRGFVNWYWVLLLLLLPCFVPNELPLVKCEVTVTHVIDSEGSGGFRNWLNALSVFLTTRKRQAEKKKKKTVILVIALWFLPLKLQPSILGASPFLTKNHNRATIKRELFNSISNSLSLPLLSELNRLTACCSNFNSINSRQTAVW